MTTESVVQEKIAELLMEKNPNLFLKIMVELAQSPQSLDSISTIDRTIDMVCEETFG